MQIVNVPLPAGIAAAAEQTANNVVIIVASLVDLPRTSAAFAAPAAVSSYPMAVAMDADGDFAAQMVAYTTIFCLPTIFLWTLFLNSMGWI